MSRHALLISIVALLLATLPSFEASANDDENAYPRMSVGAVLAVAVPKFDGQLDAGGFVSGNLGLRLNEWVQVDAFDGSGFWSRQSQEPCGTGIPCNWDVDALFLGSAVRLGWFRKPGDGKQLPNPFIIGGLGAGRVTNGELVSGHSNWGISGNAGAGVEIPFGEHFTGGVTYRFFAMGDDSSGERLKLHSIGFEFGWR